MTASGKVFPSEKKRLARMNDIKSSSRSPIKARETGALPWSYFNPLKSLLACICLTAYSQTTSQADLLVEEAQKLESKQDYPTAITKLKQADELYVKTGKTQSAERATCLHILGRCYLNLERPEGLTYTQMAADMRKTILGETNIKYISSLNNCAVAFSPVLNRHSCFISISPAAT